MSDDRDARLSVWFWLGLPLILYFGLYALRALTSQHFYDQYILHELGFTEQATLATLIVTLLVGLLVLARTARLGEPKLLIFYTLFWLGCFYFAGEEASWGQHLLGWHTPAEWDTINNQDETNLHNLSGLAGSLLDQLPRNLLGVAALIGGVIIPLVRRARNRHYHNGSFAWWIMPSPICIPAALIAALGTVPQKISKAVAGDVVWPMNIDAGEVKELMIAAFLLIYITAVWIRLRRQSQARPQA